MLDRQSHMTNGTASHLNFLLRLFSGISDDVNGVCPGTTAHHILVAVAGHNARVSGDGGTFRGEVGVSAEAVLRELQPHVLVPYSREGPGVSE